MKVQPGKDDGPRLGPPVRGHEAHDGAREKTGGRRGGASGGGFVAPQAGAMRDGGESKDQ